MATKKGEALRREVEAEPRGRGQLYTDDLRERLTAYASARQSSGASWRDIGAELGVAPETLRRWCAGATQMRAVRVVADRVSKPERTMSVVSPSGHRVEGLSFDEVVALLGALR